MPSLPTSPKYSPMKRRNRGFTLLELMITVALVAIMITVVMPGFSEFFIRNRLTAQTNDFITAISLARNEAIKRGRPVCLARTGTYWEGGYRIFVDKNSLAYLPNDSDVCRTNGAIGCSPASATCGCPPGDGSCEIQVQDIALTGAHTLRATSGAGSGPYQLWLRFNAMGVAVDRNNNGIAGAFRLCRSDQNSTKSNLISISVAGSSFSKSGSGICP